MPGSARVNFDNLFFKCERFIPTFTIQLIILNNSMDGGINLKNITLLTEPRTITEQLCRCQTVGSPPPPRIISARETGPNVSRNTQWYSHSIMYLTWLLHFDLLCDFFESSTNSPPLKKFCFRLAEDLSTRDRSRKQIPQKGKPTA